MTAKIPKTSKRKTSNCDLLMAAAQDGGSKWDTASNSHWRTLANIAMCLYFHTPRSCLSSAFIENSRKDFMFSNAAIQWGPVVGERERGAPLPFEWSRSAVYDVHSLTEKYKTAILIFWGRAMKAMGIKRRRPLSRDILTCVRDSEQTVDCSKDALSDPIGSCSTSVEY